MEWGDYKVDFPTGILDLFVGGWGNGAPGTGESLHVYYNYSVPFIPIVAGKNIVAYYNYSQTNPPMAADQTLIACYNYTNTIWDWVKLDRHLYIDEDNPGTMYDLVYNGIVYFNLNYLPDGLYSGSKIFASYTFELYNGVLNSLFYFLPTYVQ